MNQRNTRLEPIADIPPISDPGLEPLKKPKDDKKIKKAIKEETKKIEKKAKSKENTFKKSQERYEKTKRNSNLPYSAPAKEKSGAKIKKAIDEKKIKVVPIKINNAIVTDVCMDAGIDPDIILNPPDASSASSGSGREHISNPQDIDTDKLSNDVELKQLFELLRPSEETDTLVPGISANRIKRAQLVCQRLKEYTEEERAILVYPTIYTLHMYGYHRAEIAAIIGIMPATVREYLKDCRRIFKDELIKELTSEDRVADSLAHYDFIKKEALKRASTASDERASSYLRLAALVESERNKLLEDTGYFEQVKRKNELEAIEASNPGRQAKSKLVDDIREIMSQGNRLIGDKDD